MKKKKTLLFFLYAFVCISYITAQTEIYVTPEGSGLKNGSSWDNALVGNGSGNDHLYKIIENADENTVIYVGGPNAANTEALFSLPSATAYYMLKKGVQVLGGYYDVGGTAQRDIDNPNTVLTVDNRNRNRAVIQADVNRGDDPDITGALYEGFAIRDAGSTFTSSEYGGAFLISGINTAGNDPVLKNLKITNCYAQYGGGGTLRNNTAEVAIAHINIDGCYASGNGGGLYIFRSFVKVDDISANNCRAVSGGGMYVRVPEIEGTDIKITNLHLESNQTSGSGGGLYVYGDALSAKNITITFENVTAINNTAAIDGGGIFTYYFRKAYNVRADFKKVTATGNTCGNFGGGVCNYIFYGSYSDLTANNNTAWLDGGGVYNTSANVDFTNLIANENTATRGSGGGIYNTTFSGDFYGTNTICDNTAWLDGGGAYNTTFRGDFYNLTANRNTATNGSGGGTYNTTFKGSFFGTNEICYNTALVDGGGTYNTTFTGNYDTLTVSYNTAGRDGGGMYNTTVKTQLPNLIAEYNTAGSHGGGLYNTTVNGPTSDVLVANGRVNYNVAKFLYGGGFYNTTVYIELRHLEVRGNYARASGGGLYNTTVHHQKMWNVLIVENYSGGFGGGIHNTTAHADGHTEELRYVNTTIACNYSVHEGGGVYNTTANQWYQNCIVAENYSDATTASNMYNDVIANNKVYKILIDQSLIFTISNKEPAFVTINYSKLSPNNCEVGNELLPQFVDPINTTLLATIAPRDLGYAGDYHLQITSPCIDKGHDNFILPYKWMDVDLDRGPRILGAAVDMGAYEGPGTASDCPPIAIWNPTGANDNSWNSAGNWKPNKVPKECTTVYIPGDAKTFPYLSASDNARCNRLFFMQGGEIGRQDLLTYNRAYVQYNFRHNNYAPSPDAETTIQNATNYSKISIKDHLAFSGDRAKSTISRSKWHMLSAPVKKVVSGDFAFGGYPRTFMRRFILQNEGDYTIGQFTDPFPTQNVELQAGEGFAYWMNDYDNKKLYMEYGTGNDEQGLDATYFNVATREYGIRVCNGVLQLPYFEADTMLMAHRITKFNQFTGISDFYHYDIESNNLTILNQNDIFPRITADIGGDLLPYTLHDAQVSYNVKEIKGEKEILIGNPFMSTIDFEKFYTDNSGSIYGTYRIYNGASYDVFHLGSDDAPGSSAATGGLDELIPPLQGFFVTLKDSKLSDNLLFDIENISIIRPESSSSVLKSAKQTGEINTIRIKVFNAYAESEAIIRKQAGATNQYKASEDVYKLFSSDKGVPEVYTYSGDYPSVMNFIGSDDVTIPVGIRTAATIGTTFHLTGMDNYKDAEIFFIDTELNEKTAITGKELYEYSFDNTVGNVPGRFFIQLVAKPNSIHDAPSESSINIHAASGKITVTSSAGDLIKQISIYNAQGELIYNAEAINTNFVSLIDEFTGQNVLIIKVITEKESKNAKILLK